MRKLDDNTANRLKSTSVSCSYAVGLHWFGIGAASGHITTTFSSMMLHTPSTDFGEILSSIIARVNAVLGPSQDATPMQVGGESRRTSNAQICCIRISDLSDSVVGKFSHELIKLCSYY